MKRRERNSRLIADINIAPFTDVILVLLIIFMVTTPFIYRSSIKIALPQVSQNEAAAENKDINVTITASGDIYLENERFNMRLDMNLFKFKLESLAKKSKDSAIIISGDKSVKYDFVVQVVDIASKIGIKHLVLATQVKK